MSAPLYLCMRWWEEGFSDRADGEEGEWPPSPLRLFQSLLAAAAARWRTQASFPEIAAAAFAWLEALGPPLIVAPPAAAARRIFPADAPPVPPGEEGVHYLWDLSGRAGSECEVHKEVLFAAARSLAAPGWGRERSAGHGRLLTAEEADALGGERWRPGSTSSQVRLRSPRPGTLAALIARQDRFLAQPQASGGFFSLPAQTVFENVGYGRDTDLSGRPFAAFALLTQEGDRLRAFDPLTHTPAVAGMLRHATAEVAYRCRSHARGWVERFVLGHGEGARQPATTDERFAYFPLPTLEERRPKNMTAATVGAIRRVLVAEPGGGSGREASWVRQRLGGQVLMDERSARAVAVLSLLPGNDRRLHGYLGPAAVWSTVTPVILPGYDDRVPRKTERLLRNVLGQAGLPETPRKEAHIEWNGAGFRPGVAPAVGYRVDAHHRHLPRYHVRLTFRAPVRGPLCLGAGRYFGMGLLAAESFHG